MSEVCRVPIDSDLDIVAARVEGRNLAREMGFGVIDQARIATVVSELARNVVLYAGSGLIILGQKRNGDQMGLEIICQDQGPGIDDTESVLNDEQATEPQDGMGLAGVRQLMDVFVMDSEPGVGTTITVCRWLP